MTNRTPSASTTRQRGAATLIVVMLLFFVLALTAGYASRNLIFEQRTSANQYRSTQSLEAAEAGLEWVQAMLNSGRIDANCLPTANAASDNFRQRYLITNPNGSVMRRLTDNVRAACTFDGSDWQCVCPTSDLQTTSLPVVGPAFAVRLVDISATLPGLVRAEVNGCERYDVSCLNAGNEFNTTNCQSTLCSLLSLHSGLKSPPSAAVTSGGSITGTALAATNEATTTAGVTLHARDAITLTTETLISLPGTPAGLSKRGGDTASLTFPADAGSCLDCMFTSVFGLRPDTYRRQGAILEIDCTSACSVAAINTALGSARSRLVWLRGGGGLTLSSGLDVVGAANDPVVLVIEGPLVMAAAAATARIHGLVYAASAQLDGGRIQGALVTTGNVVGGGAALVAYDAAALTQLKLTAGSYVRVPGAWRDFP